MRISLTQDVGAPVERVWAEAADPSRFEARSRARGVEVTRLGPPGALAPGAAWRVRFSLAGRASEARVTLRRVEPPHLVEAVVEATGLRGASTARFEALGPAATRLTLLLDLGGTSLAGRLLLGGLGLARATVEARARERLAAWARAVEARGGGGPGA